MPELQKKDICMSSNMLNRLQVKNIYITTCKSSIKLQQKVPKRTK